MAEETPIGTAIAHLESCVQAQRMGGYLAADSWALRLVLDHIATLTAERDAAVRSAQSWAERAGDLVAEVQQRAYAERTETAAALANALPVDAWTGGDLPMFAEAVAADVIDLRQRLTDAEQRAERAGGALRTVQDAARAVEASVGCGDSSCLFRRATGMHTNGGCRCGMRGFVMGKLAQFYRAALAALPAPTDASAGGGHG